MLQVDVPYRLIVVEKRRNENFHLSGPFIAEKHILLPECDDVIQYTICTITSDIQQLDTYLIYRIKIKIEFIFLVYRKLYAVIGSD